MFALGGLVLAGLFLAPRATSPTAPPGVPWGVPARPLRVVACDAGGSDARAAPTSADMLLAEMRKGVSNPDYALLINVEADIIPSLAAGLGMAESYEPRLYQRVPRAPGGREMTGVCILSKFPLFEAAPIETGAHVTVGVRAVSVVDGKKILIACIAAQNPGAATAAIAAWKQLEQPPMLLATTTPQFSPSALVPLNPVADSDANPLRINAPQKLWRLNRSGRWNASSRAGVWIEILPIIPWREDGRSPAGG